MIILPQFTKKAASRSLRTIDLYLYFQFVVKYLKELYIFVSNDLTTKSQSGFRPDDSTVSQLIDPVTIFTSHLTIVNRLKSVQSSFIYPKRLSQSGIRDCPSN